MEKISELVGPGWIYSGRLSEYSRPRPMGCETLKSDIFPGKRCSGRVAERVDPEQRSSEIVKSTANSGEWAVRSEIVDARAWLPVGFILTGSERSLLVLPIILKTEMKR